MPHPVIRPGAVAVVTGGASGIGLAAARRFGAAGMRVLLADLDAAALDAAVAGLSAEGIAARGLVTDVRWRDDIVALKATADAEGPVGILMNNAGREGGGGILAGPEVWEATLATNLVGVVHGLQVFLPDMLAGDGPAAIVNTGSKQGITLPPGDTAYNVSKAALKALTEGMARGEFYILCPDNEVDRATDLKRIRWAAGDLLENRPALSRWHPDFAAAFAAHMAAPD